MFGSKTVVGGRLNSGIQRELDRFLKAARIWKENMRLGLTELFLHKSALANSKWPLTCCSLSVIL